MKHIIILILLLTSFFTEANKTYESFDCKKEVEQAAITKLIGTTKSAYKVLFSKNYGKGVFQLGNMKLNLYTVEISDEADGGVIIVFANKKTCNIHDVIFGTHALDR